MTILIADDNSPNRELMRELLEAEGHSVLEAADGGQALSLVCHCRPHLVFLDLHMPVLDGFSVLREIQARSRFGLPHVVAVTASAMLGDRERALAAGFDFYITKPFRLRDVRGYVRGLSCGCERLAS